ncbi:hypothetical protein [Caloramator proteoclasticus]|uniref:hypothetical protein n=1 Tax=Caloramator proteoclasticus TaxID=53342 RepID=UPI0009329026|nr:hypothetical protein [Caloramator proteoclasticus]
MSKKCCGLNNMCSLIILLLILLQFGRRGPGCHNDGPVDCIGGNTTIDNSVLFVIVLYYLICCGCGKK